LSEEEERKLQKELIEENLKVKQEMEEEEMIA